MNAQQRNQTIFSKNDDPAFVKSGFCDYKNAVRAFKRHSQCEYYREAVAACNDSSTLSVAVQLNSQISRDQAVASRALNVIISSLRYFARQGLPIRGHTDKSGNLYELIMLRSSDNPEVESSLKRERFVYTSHEIQNEVLQLMAHSVLRSLIADISKARIFSLIVNETTDQSTDEQVSVCVRYVDDEMQPYEVFLGLYQTADTTGESQRERHVTDTWVFCVPVSGEATGGFGGGLTPPLASMITHGIRTKPQRNFFGKGVGVPHYLASAYLKS
jgi:hypothetical protein